MLSTIIVAAGLSTGHKIGLAVTGAAFIVFALVCSFVLPLRNPNFPGKRMGLFLTVCAVFFGAMLAAVIVFGRESKEASAERTVAVTTTHAPTTPPQGDPAAGKAVFTSAGCVSCHTLKAANSHGTIGPNLDTLTPKPSYARIVKQVEHGGKIMPPFAGRLSPTQIHDVAAFVYVSIH